jgi:hypothetical protein
MRARWACRCWSPTTTCRRSKTARGAAEADVIVNPNQPGCGFESKALAGVGVMFYVLLATRAELRTRGAFDAAGQPRLDALLDLVALGTVADVVKLDANNRRLVAQGLKRIRAGRMQAGVAALFTVPPARPARPRLRLRLRARPAHQRRRAAGRHDAGHRVPAHRRRRHARRSWRAARRHQPRAPRGRGRHARAGRGARWRRFTPRRARRRRWRCSTKASTKAWSASSPAA